MKKVIKAVKAALNNREDTPVQELLSLFNDATHIEEDKIRIALCGLLLSELLFKTTAIDLDPFVHHKTWKTAIGFRGEKSMTLDMLT